MKILFSFFFFSFLIFGQNTQKQADTMTGYFILIGFVATLAFFFWGVYKAAKTQKIIYMLAMLPFILGIIGMFFL
ncbi:MAG: hypothetical protein QG564_743 [Campylobacterota bacterium]|nr:hypothetical protein [Campylobacterota bacterium]